MSTSTSAVYSPFIYTNCTFNINLSTPLSSGGNIFIFGGSIYGKTKLINCSVRLSGSGFDTIYMNTSNVSYDTVTFENNQSNPLQCYSFNCAPVQLGYNYYKLYCTTSDTIVITDALGLINTSRLTATGGKTLTGIVMQETDPTTSDYIYNQQNLADAGFLVGQVIT
jgi:hypothetical protein